MDTKADSLRKLLKRYGLRYSAPRASILRLFREAPRHVSAEGLYFELKHRGGNLSLSTVYLNLSVLSEAGLLRKFKGVSGETIYDSNLQPHDHLLCERSGEVVDLQEIEINGVPLGRYLKERIEEETGWQVSEPQLEFRGVAPRNKS
jgi:Fur family peroxide stress response transcriptional regulator